MIRWRGIQINSRCWFLAAWLLTWGSANYSAAHADARARILIVKTRDNAFYNPVVEGITGGLKSRGLRDKIETAIIALSGKPDADAQQIHTQLSKHPQLIFAVGTDAATLLLKEKPDVPVLFSMVLDPVALGLVKSLDAPGDGFTGTTLLVSPGKQLDSLMQAVPTVHKVGVLYTDNDPTSLAFLAEAQKDAQRLRLELITRAAHGPDAPDSDLTQMGNVDAFWLIPDPASTGPQALKSTLQYANAHHLPVLGASSGSVHAGALLALSANLQDVGDLTADMAAHILDKSEIPAKMRVRGPRLTLLSVSLDAARSLNLKIPDAMLHLADEVCDTQSDAKKEGE